MLTITFAALQKNASAFRCFTGLTVTGFEALLPAFERAYEADLDQRDAARKVKRQRARGGGSRGKLRTLADKLVFILCYFKLYPVQELQGYLFDLQQTQAWDWIHRLTPILHQALGYEQQLPARPTRNLAEVLQHCPGLEFVIDGTERPTQRPQVAEQRDARYSGKKKRYTVKNVIVTARRTKKVLVLSATVPGKTHDKKVADDMHLDFPTASQRWQDTGFQGYAPPGATVHQPTKKPRGGELTLAQKQVNVSISRERVGIEHSLAGVKTLGIVHDVYRNRRAEFEDVVMEIACGLHNWRIDHPLTS